MSLSQAAKVTPFAAGNEADVRKSAAGDFFQWTKGSLRARADPRKGHTRGHVTRFSKKPNSAAVAARGIAGAAPNFGRQLGAVARRVREGQGLTLTDVATTAGISAGMLSRLETGHVTPSLETLVALAGAPGGRPALPLPQLGGGEGGAQRGPPGPRLQGGQP